MEYTSIIFASRDVFPVHPVTERFMELTKKKTQVMKVLLFDGDPAKARVPKSLSDKRVHDILRKTIDDAIPLRQRGAAFKLEGKRHLLQPWRLCIIR